MQLSKSSLFCLFDYRFVYWSKDHMEKCSESTGKKFVLNLFNSSLIKFHPQIIASLLAIAIFFEDLIIFSVGSSPFKPDIEHIT